MKLYTDDQCLSTLLSSSTLNVAAVIKEFHLDKNFKVKWNEFGSPVEEAQEKNVEKGKEEASSEGEEKGNEASSEGDDCDSSEDNEEDAEDEEDKEDEGDAEDDPEFSAKLTAKLVEYMQIPHPNQGKKRKAETEKGGKKKKTKSNKE